MSVIVFAPLQTNLTLQSAEVATIVNAFYRPRLAHTEAELRQLAKDDDSEGFWFVGHSNDKGIIADAQTMTPATLGQYLAVAGVDWSFLNSCESAAFIDQLQAIYSHDCYANITEVNDETAWRTAALVAAKYADVGDIHRAVALAVPPGATPLRFFPSPNSLDRGIMSREESTVGSRLSDQMSDLTKAIYALQNEIALSEQRTKMEIALLTRRVEQIERADSSAKPLLPAQQAMMIVGALVVIAALLASGLYVFATGG